LPVNNDTVIRIHRIECLSQTNRRGIAVRVPKGQIRRRWDGKAPSVNVIGTTRVRQTFAAGAALTVYERPIVAAEAV
jgi:hypothetical protein